MTISSFFSTVEKKTIWKSANEIFSKTIAFFKREISIDLLTSSSQYLLLSFCLNMNDGFSDSSIQLAKRNICQTLKDHFGKPFHSGIFRNKNFIEKDVKVK